MQVTSDISLNFKQKEVDVIKYGFLVADLFLTDQRTEVFSAHQLRTFPYVAEDTLEITKIHEGYAMRARFAVPFTQEALKKYFSRAQLISTQEIYCELAYLEDVRQAIHKFSAYKFIRPDVPDPFSKTTSSGKDMPEQAQMT